MCSTCKPQNIGPTVRGCTQAMIRRGGERGTPLVFRPVFNSSPGRCSFLATSITGRDNPAQGAIGVAEDVRYVKVYSFPQRWPPERQG